MIAWMRAEKPTAVSMDILRDLEEIRRKAARLE
jgi:hypothetical protein